MKPEYYIYTWLPDASSRNELSKRAEGHYCRKKCFRSIQSFKRSDSLLRSIDRRGSTSRDAETKTVSSNR